MQRHVQRQMPTLFTRIRDRASEWHHVVLPLLVLTWLSATAWLRPLALPDEGRYVGVAWEMLRSGNWLVPTMDTLPYFHKPPLFYWLTAIALAIFGVNEWAARLPSLLAATAAAVGLHQFVRAWLGEPTARTTLLILTTTPFFFGAAQVANLDMLVAACISGSILCAAHAVLCLQSGQPHRLPLAGAYALAGLGVLAKGLIGVVLPTIVVGGWLFLTVGPSMILRLIWLPGIALCGLIAVPWFALMEARYSGFLDYFFVHHHFRRYLTAEFNNPQPFWYYAPVLAAVTLPWCTFLPWAVRRPEPGTIRRNIHTLLWIWLIATVAFFSLPKSKMLGYVLPTAPPLAALAAVAIARLAGSYIGSRKNVAINALLAASVCVVVVGALALRHTGDVAFAATEIRGRMAPGDRVVALNQYPFSVPFYLRYRDPVRVVLDWDVAWVQRKDTWRKELYDAAGFAPARGAGILLRPGELPGLLCLDRAWVFGTANDILKFPALQKLEQIARSDQAVVWFGQPSESLCARRD